MSDKVIRLGGSHLSNPVSLNNLKQYAGAVKGRSYVVVSAVPEILETLETHLSSVFRRVEERNSLKEQLLQVFKQTTGSEVSHAYIDLAKQAANLLRGIALIGDYSVALKDQVLSYAERLSVEILKTVWGEAVVLLPEEIDLRSTTDYGNATFLSVDLAKLAELNNGIYLIPGTYGISENGKISRTGKTAAERVRLEPQRGRGQCAHRRRDQESGYHTGFCRGQA